MKTTLTRLMAAAGLALLSLTAHAQLTDLHDIDASSGDNPYSNVVVKGNLIVGTTVNDNASLFVMATDGSGFNVLHHFPAYSGDGEGAVGTLVLEGNTIYGTTYYGGQYGIGTLYKINLNGTGYATLHNFGDGTDAAMRPGGGLTISGKTLYGATPFGGLYHAGALYSINTDGTNYHLLYSFGGNMNDGANPHSRPIVKGTTIYGVTYYGGFYNGGTVYKINTDGSGYSQLWYFYANDNVEGFYPVGGLVLKGHLLYGTTSQGGSYGAGQIFYVDTANNSGGTVHDFGASGDGGYPIGDMILIGKTFYGTTGSGGANGYGTIFAIKTKGTNYAVLHSFNGLDGYSPNGPLTSSGLALYGSTFYGGANGIGTVFQYIR